MRIFTQRLSPLGQRLWGESRPVTTFISRQSRPLLIADGLGGAIIVWVDERNVLGLKDLFAQRLSAQGAPLWEGKGLMVCSENGDQIDASLTPDGAGGLVVTWTDFRRGDRNPDIYAQRLDQLGKALWQTDGVIVCGAPDVQRTPKVIRDDNDNFLITWTDKGSGSYDIYAQLLNKSGQALWLIDGIPVSQAARTQQNAIPATPRFVVWEDYRSGNWDLGSNSISPQGTLQWGENGVTIVNLPTTQYSPQAVAWENQALLTAWEDYRSGKQYEIYLQKLSAEGNPTWAADGVLVKSNDGARVPRLQTFPEDNSFVVAWEDYTGGGKALYGQKFKID